MVVFKEVLPNPSGKDTDGEWIKLTNTGDSSVNISGWGIQDEGQKQFSLSGLSTENQTISKQKDLLLPYSITRIPLNNDGDTLKLYDGSGDLVDELNYKGPVSDDEIIYGTQFSLKEEENLPTNENLDTLAFSGQGVSKNPAILTPIFIALVIAALFGVGIGFLMRQIFKKEDERTRVRF